MKNIIFKFLFLTISLNFFFNNIKTYSNTNKKLIEKVKIENFYNSEINELRIEKNNIQNILKILKRYDYQNAPKKKIVNGQITYTYKRSENEQKKTVKELETLINNPEKTERYEKFITKTISYLLFSGVRIYIKEIKRDISAEWIYKNQNIIFNEKSLKEGTKNFAYLLSHEVIHIAQSCKGGYLNSYPVLLNLNLAKPKSYYYRRLKSSAYKNLKKNEVLLEIEAYANEENLLQTLNLFKYFCLKNNVD